MDVSYPTRESHILVSLLFTYGQRRITISDHSADVDNAEFAGSCENNHIYTIVRGNATLRSFGKSNTDHIKHCSVVLNYNILAGYPLRGNHQRV